MLDSIVISHSVKVKTFPWDVSTDLAFNQTFAHVRVVGPVQIAPFVNNVTSTLLTSLFFFTAICDPPCVHGFCAGPDSCNCEFSGWAQCEYGEQTCACDEDEC